MELSESGGISNTKKAILEALIKGIDNFKEFQSSMADILQNAQHLYAATESIDECLRKKEAMNTVGNSHWELIKSTKLSLKSGLEKVTDNLSALNKSMEEIIDNTHGLYEMYESLEESSKKREGDSIKKEEKKEGEKSGE